MMKIQTFFRYGVLTGMGVLLFTRCAVQEVEPLVPAGVPFEVVAAPVETKTVNSGLSTQWVQGDRFNLFHAPAGTKAYVADGAFAVADVETGQATGTIQPLSGNSYDWYMVYPYIQQATSPAAVSVTVGAPSGEAQVQTGADDMSHLAGENFPLMGKASAVPATEVPNLAVSPALSVIAVNVTNAGETAATVSEIRFRAPEALVGTFRVNVTGTDPSFTAVNASDEAVLSVKGGAVLAAGDNAVFYLGIKPFTAQAGAELTLTVNDQVRTLTLTRTVTFSAGRMKTLNFNLETGGSGEAGVYYFKRVTSSSAGKKYIFVAEEEGTGDFVMASALPADSKSGTLEGVVVEEADGVIALESLGNAFGFFASDYGILIRQADERYLYNSSASNDNVYAGTSPNASYYWTVTHDSAGRTTMTNARDRQIKYNETIHGFQARKTADSGLLFYLYELQNGDDAIEAFISHEVPGVYAYDGSDWLYTEGSHQLSVRASGDQFAFRMFEPAQYTVIQVTGLPVALAEKDRFTVRMVRSVKQAVTHAANFDVQVVRIADGKAWLMAGNGTGFIVCIQ